MVLNVAGGTLLDLYAALPCHILVIIDATGQRQAHFRQPWFINSQVLTA
jgi:hypothetical protein